MSVITGTTGNDGLYGTSGSDQIYGLAGDDFINGGAGADTLDGGDGYDVAAYDGAATGVTVDLANVSLNTNDAAGDVYTSIERIAGTIYADTLRGDGGNNDLAGRDGNDVIEGRDGDDFLNGGNGADVLNGGNGIDWADYNFSSAAVTVDLAAGSGANGEASGDTYVSIENVKGSSYGDTLYGNGSANTLLGQNGDDYLSGGGGADVLDGGSGIDVAGYDSVSIGVTVDLANPSLNAGDAIGDSYISIERIAGTSLSDVLSGDVASNDLRGRGGNDILDGRDGDDFLEGGAGADTIIGGYGYDVALYDSTSSAVTVDLANISLNTGEAAGDSYSGIERIAGSIYGDTLRGDSYNNDLAGRDGNDVLEGRDGDDYLTGGNGADTISGGNGADTADYVYSSSSVIVNLKNNTASGGEAQGDVLSSIESIKGSAYGDGLYGDDGVNTLYGMGGDDFLNGHAGGDLLNGGDGYDVAAYDGASTGIVVDLQNLSLNTGDAAGDTYVAVEKIAGTIYQDELNGDGSNNDLAGRDGDDFLHGRDGNDILDGGAGEDHLDGGAGFDTVTYQFASSGITVAMNSVGTAGEALGDHLTGIEKIIGSNYADTIHGDNPSDDNLSGLGGDDILNGYGGQDTMNGGAGNDYVNGGYGDDMLTGGAGSDVFDFDINSEHGDIILDFEQGSDHIDVSTLDANYFAGGNQAFNFIGTASFGSPATGQLRYYKVDNAGADNDWTIVQANGGYVDPNLTITLKGLYDLTAGDFYL